MFVFIYLSKAYNTRLQLVLILAYQVLCYFLCVRSTLTYLLMPDFDGEDKEDSSLFNWVSGLGVLGTAKLIWHLVDIVSDFGLLWTLSTVNNEHWMLISAAAVCTKSFCYVVIPTKILLLHIKIN